jgi:methylmalonyl-CoA mutase N-terminal domain/subunit
VRTAAGDERTNLLPLIVEGVEAYCTLGEISDSLRSVWGEARDFGRI